MKKSTSIVLAVLLVAALVAGGVFLSQKGDLQKKVDELSAQVTTLTGELDTAKKDAAAAAEEAAALKQQAEEIAAAKAQEAADAAAAEAAAAQAEADAAAAAAAQAAAEAEKAAATDTPVDTTATAEVTAEPTQEAKAEETAAPTEEAKAEETAAPAEEAKAEETAAPAEKAAEDKPAEGYEIAMITDIGTINDKSFNQGTWEGIVAYAEKNNKTHNYYQPMAKTTEAYLEKIEEAVNAGAKIIVTPGFLFEPAIYLAQDMYPEVHFVLIDGNPNDGDFSKAEGPTYRTEKNVVGIVYAEEQAGFLAGYAAVKDGYTKLGFMGGMAVPAVIRFGYGFVQGIEYAAKEMDIKDLTVNYHYTGDFKATPEVQSLAASWFADGNEVIFACGGAVGDSVMAAAKAADAKVIGVDVDQSPESETVITSAMKGLAESVEQTLDAFYAGKFPGGEMQNKDAAVAGVSLPMDTSKFKTFSQADYDAIFAKLVDGEVKLLNDSDVKSVTEIPVTAVTVTEIK